MFVCTTQSKQISICSRQKFPFHLCSSSGALLVYFYTSNTRQIDGNFHFFYMILFVSMAATPFMSLVHFRFCLMICLITALCPYPLHQSEGQMSGLKEEFTVPAVAAPTPGTLQQRKLNSFSLEEQKILLSLDRLNHRLHCKLHNHGRS